MSFLGLVADYGSDEGGSSDDEPQKASSKVNIQKKSAKVAISDESDSGDNFTGVSSLKLALPQPKIITGKGFTDTPQINKGDVVEIGPIPPKKVYGDEDKIVPPAKVSLIPNLTSKKVGGVVKISIPSLKDFANDDIEDTSTRRLIQAPKKGSGLFSILPEPKFNQSVIRQPKSNLSTSSSSYNFNSNDQEDDFSDKSSSSSTSAASSSTPKAKSSMIPHVIQQKLAGRPAPSKLDEIRSKYLRQDANVKIVHSGSASASASSSGNASSSSSTKKKKSRNDSDDEDSDEGGGDFFSLDSSSNIVIDDPETLKRLQLPTPLFDEIDKQKTQEEMWTDGNSEKYYDTTNPQSSTDDAELMQFIAGGKKRKGKGGEAINIIDVSADDLRPPTNDWIKNITDTSAIPPRKVKGPGGITKRKHQITYLAFEAKAREQELQNQWAENRHTKRQTQAKYGF